MKHKCTGRYDCECLEEEIKMTTPAKMALDAINTDDDFAAADSLWAYRETIRAALKVLDEVQSVYAQLPETVLRDTKHRIGAEMYRDHLKQIAGV